MIKKCLILIFVVTLFSLIVTFVLYSFVTKNYNDGVWTINKHVGGNSFYVSLIPDAPLEFDMNKKKFKVHVKKVKGGKMLCCVPLWHGRTSTNYRELIKDESVVIFSGLINECRNMLLLTPEDKGKQQVEIWMTDDTGVLENRYKIEIKNSNLPSF